MRQEVEEACRNPDKWMPIRSAGFDQQDRIFRIFAETIGQDAAGRAGSDDYEVKFKIIREKMSAWQYSYLLTELLVPVFVVLSRA